MENKNGTLVFGAIKNEIDHTYTLVGVDGSLDECFAKNRYLSSKNEETFENNPTIIIAHDLINKSIETGEELALFEIDYDKEYFVNTTIYINDQDWKKSTIRFIDITEASLEKADKLNTFETIKESNANNPISFTSTTFLDHFMKEYIRLGEYDKFINYLIKCAVEKFNSKCNTFEKTVNNFYSIRIDKERKTIEQLDNISNTALIELSFLNPCSHIFVYKKIDVNSDNDIYVAYDSKPEDRYETLIFNKNAIKDLNLVFRFKSQYMRPSELALTDIDIGISFLSHHMELQDYRKGSSKYLYKIDTIEDLDKLRDFMHLFGSTEELNSYLLSELVNSKSELSITDIIASSKKAGTELSIEQNEKFKTICYNLISHILIEKHLTGKELEVDIIRILNKNNIVSKIDIDKFFNAAIKICTDLGFTVVIKPSRTSGRYICTIK